MVRLSVLVAATLGSSASAALLAMMPKCWKSCSREAGLMCQWGDMSCMCKAANSGVLARTNACACAGCGETEFKSRLGISMAEMSFACRMTGQPLAPTVARTISDGASCQAVVPPAEPQMAVPLAPVQPPMEVPLAPEPQPQAPKPATTQENQPNPPAPEAKAPSEQVPAQPTEASASAAAEPSPVASAPISSSAADVLAPSQVPEAAPSTVSVVETILVSPVPASAASAFGAEATPTTDDKSSGAQGSMQGMKDHVHGSPESESSASQAAGSNASSSASVKGPAGSSDTGSSNQAASPSARGSGSLNAKSTKATSAPGVKFTGAAATLQVRVPATAMGLLGVFAFAFA